ncbi:MULTISPECIES: Crp/Fnr family transcriptional regulator [unclassified Stappia]|uniref:Crp/Fnr family transcriptional regulator n=1 Tax=unclassified Stappia TaxID=2629676 RepID=UPI001643AB67|nr:MULTISPECIES: helix-turn-helix domain-containing protein [unclassified Stappia]
MAYLDRTSETIGQQRVTGRAVREVAKTPTARVQRHEQHHVIFYEGDQAERIFELQDGIVMLYKLLPDGRRQVVEILNRGMIFGTAGGERYDCSAETLTPVRLAVHDRREVDASAVLQSHVAKCLMSQMERLHEHAMLLGRKSAMERVASYLIRMVPNRGGEGCTGPLSETCDPHDLVLTMTRQEIADYLGLTIETVSRVISELKRRGVIRLERQDRIHVTRVCGLCQLTGIH